MVGDASMNSNLYVGLDASFNRNAWIGQKTTMVGDASMNSNLYVGLDASFNRNAWIGQKTTIVGDVSMNSNLYVGLDASFNRNVFIKGISTFRDDIYQIDGSYNINIASAVGTFPNYGTTQNGNRLINVGSGNFNSTTTGLNDCIAIGNTIITATNPTGYGYIGIGKNIFPALTSGFQNIGIGNAIATSMTVGHNNVFIGNGVVSSATSTGNTVAIGTAAGKRNTTGINNTFIGAFTDTILGTYNNSTALGYGATITTSNQIKLGTSTERVDISGNLNVSGTITAITSLVGALTGTASDLAGGLGGSIPYQTAVNNTSMLANGTAGQVLTSAGTTLAPTWSTPSTVATDLTGGLGGSIPYQTAVNNTSMLANGTAGQVLTSAGTTLAPTWTTPNATTATITSTNTSGTYYPVFASAAGSGQTLRIDDSTTPFSFNPNTSDINFGDSMRVNATGQYVALGFNAGSNGGNTVAIGYSAGQSGQGLNGIAIGCEAGFGGQGVNAIAIGHKAGRGSQDTGSIIINATGDLMNSLGANRFYVKPIRGTNTATPVIVYNASNGEITYNTSSIKYKKNVIDLQEDTSKIYNIRAREYDSKIDDIHHIGYIAEELNEVDTNFTWKQNDLPEGIEWFNMLIYTIEEMKKLKKRIEDLESMRI